jgi:hypothetical protein
LGPLGTAPTNGLLCKPRVIMMMEKLVQRFTGEPKYSEKTCHNAAMSTTKYTCCLDLNPGHSGWKPESNRLTYGTALTFAVDTASLSTPSDKQT